MRVVKVLEKHPTEDRVYVFAFADEPEIVAGEVIVGASVLSNPTSLTIGSVTINDAGNQVAVRLLGGNDGTRYEVECTATTDAGNVLVACGYLDVANC
jgi:hypothetical protein